MLGGVGDHLEMEGERRGKLNVFIATFIRGCTKEFSSSQVDPNWG
jgi:hypothetical protein